MFNCSKMDSVPWSQLKEKILASFKAAFQYFPRGCEGDYKTLGLTFSGFCSNWSLPITKKNWELLSRVATWMWYVVTAETQECASTDQCRISLHAQWTAVRYLWGVNKQHHPIPVTALTQNYVGVWSVILLSWVEIDWGLKRTQNITPVFILCAHRTHTHTHTHTHKHTLHPGYNDIGLCDTSSLHSYIPWYQLTLHCSLYHYPTLLWQHWITARQNILSLMTFNRVRLCICAGE